MRFPLKKMVHVSLLIAIEIILSRFLSISTPILKIGFGFVPLAICAMLYGPGWAALAGALADFIGAILFPIGVYFPGFTLTLALTGAVYGVFLGPRRGNKWLNNRWLNNQWLNLVLAVGINNLVLSLLLNSLWLSILGGTPYLALLPARLFQCAILIPIQIIVLRLLQRPVALFAKRQRAA